MKHNLTLTASSVDKLEQIEAAADGAGGTGEGASEDRYGDGAHRGALLQCDQPAWSQLKMLAACRLKGIFSHFANADAADLSDARLQLERFQEVLLFYERHSLPAPLRHMANSAAILQLPESYFDLVRPGILLYGVYPSQEVARTVVVRPALAWKSHVVYFKVILPGHPVGYGSTWQSDHMVRAVTVPVGYGDGYFRSMSHKAQVIIRGKRYPVVGRISMDQIVVNLEWDSAYNDDEVILVGEEWGPMHHR